MDDVRAPARNAVEDGGEIGVNRNQKPLPGLRLLDRDQATFDIQRLSCERIPPSLYQFAATSSAP